MADSAAQAVPKGKGKGSGKRKADEQNKAKGKHYRTEKGNQDYHAVGPPVEGVKGSIKSGKATGKGKWAERNRLSELMGSMTSEDQTTLRGHWGEEGYI